MIFLNPAVLFGLLAASIPILIHLLNLRKLKKIDFSTLTFLKELQKNKIRKIKIKQWLLLALRVLIVLFLVFAFARPTLEGVAIGGTTSAAKTTAVFILDNTFSMSVIDGQGSYLNQAKGGIQQVLKQMQEGDEAALILTSDKSHDEVNVTNDLRDFAKRVGNTELSYSTGTLYNAVVKAGEVLNRSRNFNKEIYIFSDFQADNSKKEQLSNLGQLLNKNIRMYAFQYSGKDIYNIGIDDIKLNTEIFEKNKPLNFSVTVTNYSKRSVDNIVVSLFMNGERAAQQSISLNEGGSQIISMEATPKQSGYIDVYAEVEDDDILQDNRRYLNVFIPKETPVLILADNPADAKFVELALQAAGDESSSLKITSKNLNQIASFNLNQYQSVVLIPNGTMPNPERVLSYAENGGGLIVFPGSSALLQSFQNVLKSLELPVPSQLSGAVNSTNNTILFDKVEFNHPVFTGLFLKEDKKKIESPDIYAHFRIEVRGNGTPIITLQDGSAFLSEYKIGKGKVLLYSVSPVLSWSTFPVKSVFVPLLNKSVYYTASQSRTQNSFTAGENAVINIPGSVAGQLKIIRPDKTEDFIQTSAQAGSGYITYSKTDKAGNYQILSGDRVADVFSVNPSPAESKNSYLSESDIKNYFSSLGFKGRLFYIGNREDPSKIILQARFGSELWRYFALIALCLAIAEMIIARNTKKELATI